ncbi:A disintegrin and metalloproteinase with thrombospondin motifs 18-like [Saccostrea cucullata]|uniref:A disintegrin and metalloproteinase with thrombospondin motifs 18-like n=1 Tax=Saccostrea cuccullata TaxID=36930 RepID=UPI002ED280FE
MQKKNYKILLDVSLSALDDQIRKLKDKHRRQTTTKDVVVELAVYTDSKYTERLRSKDTARRIELMIVKYNGVQMEYSRSDALGYNVKIQIKYFGFWEKDPSFYSTHYHLGKIMDSFCVGMRKSPINYDIFYMHTGETPTNIDGSAFQSSACNPLYHCGIDSLPVLAHTGTAHELGHSMGMRHDDEVGCTGSDRGVMGGQGTGWSSCSIRDFDKFLHFLLAFANILGQMHSADELCEMQYGPNFHFRNFYFLGDCEALYSCADLNEGNLFGQMITSSTHTLNGIYCGTGKICFNRRCATFEEVKMKPGVVRPGGWGPWADWQPCSRTCGTGLTYRRRFCNNPSPFNHPGCEGGDDNGYEARTCNPEPCPNDSSDINTLINQRASETCSRLLKNKVLDSTKYTSVGRKMNSNGHMKCEVSCAAVSGYTTPSFTRFGLMPQGTPCQGPAEKNYRCLDGYCRFFGCNGELNGKYDICGVCKGDNSTCKVNGVYTERTARGTRKTITEIPAGAINIRFWFDWLGVMRENYVEIYNKDGLVILSSFKQWIWDTTKNPTNFAGTYWMYTWWRQDLYAKGPLTEPVIIKHYRHGDKNNTGINYTYTVPKSAKTCQGQCANGGTFNTKICSCDCPNGFYGPQCNSRCNIYCFNGATVDQSNCACQCKEHQTGSQCKCEAGYGGEDCKTKI